MILRILVATRDGTSTCQIFGRLDAEGVEELQKAYEAAARPTQLDLTELRSIDDVGAAYLGGLVDGGVRVVGCNPYIQAVLRLGDARIRGARPQGDPEKASKGAT